MGALASAAAAAVNRTEPQDTSRNTRPCNGTGITAAEKQRKLAGEDRQLTDGALRRESPANVERGRGRNRS
eukprot:9960229-Lingulodinium_polyedra.AAC.1